MYGFCLVVLDMCRGILLDEEENSEDIAMLCKVKQNERKKLKVLCRLEIIKGGEKTKRL